MLIDAYFGFRCLSQNQETIEEYEKLTILRKKIDIFDLMLEYIVICILPMCLILYDVLFEFNNPLPELINPLTVLIVNLVSITLYTIGATLKKKKYKNNEIYIKNALLVNKACYKIFTYCMVVFIIFTIIILLNK